MSRDEMLEEAIAKAKERKEWQLVEWLRSARGGESAARWYTEKLSEARLDISNLMTENTKLRKLVRDMACEYECGYLTLPQLLADRMRELGVEV